MKIPFTKFEGAGNDFILADNRNLRWKPSSEMVASLCDRHFGIGADGLMLLEEIAGFDFRMVYYNSDGNISTMCGNGGRCITAFARSLGFNGNPFRFMAHDGVHESHILAQNGSRYLVKLKMTDTRIAEIFQDGIFLDTGSPHFVVFRSLLPETDVYKEGRSLRNDARFEPGGTNVNFLDSAEDKIFVRTYERGVENETLSCGTGVTASAIVYHATGRTDKTRISIETRGGSLSVEFRADRESYTDVWLEGDATKVFEGIIEV